MAAVTAAAAVMVVVVVGGRWQVVVVVADSVLLLTLGSITRCQSHSTPPRLGSPRTNSSEQEGGRQASSRQAGRQESSPLEWQRVFEVCRRRPLAHIGKVVSHGTHQHSGRAGKVGGRNAVSRLLGALCC